MKPHAAMRRKLVPVLLIAGLLSYPVLLGFQRLRMIPSEVIANRNERLYGYKGVVTGHVRFDDGSPAAGFPVGARFLQHRTGAAGEGSAVTDGDGRFEIRGLASYAFSVYAGNDDKPYVVPEPIQVDLTRSQRAEGIDFVLRLGPMVSVRVTDAETGRPVSGLLLTTRPGGGPGSSLGRTDDDGRAQGRVSLLTFDLSLSDPRTDRSYGPAPGYRFWRHVELDRPTDVEWEVRAYRGANSYHPALFRGVVVDLKGNPVPGAFVRLDRNGCQITTSDRKGRFSFKSSRMQDPGGGRGGAVIQAHKGPMSGSVVPTAAETWGTIRIVLDSAAQGAVFGRVVDLAGNPARNCRINYYGLFGTGQEINQVIFDTTSTDDNGRFLIDRLPLEGGYKFSFGGPSNDQDFGITSVPRGALNDLMRVSAGERKDLGTIAVPLADQGVGGVIVDEDGGPPKGAILVELTGEHTSLPAYPDGSGHFEFKAVASEPLTLKVFVGTKGPGTSAFFRAGDDSPDMLLKTSVRAGERHLHLVVKMRPAKP